MEYCEVYRNNGEGYIFSHVNYSVGRKRIAWADIQAKTLNLLKTDNERIKRHQEKLKAEYKDYTVVYY